MKPIKVTDVRGRKLLGRVHTAYLFGLLQRTRRIEPRNTVFAWCGYDKLPKYKGNCLYAAYRYGLETRTITQ